MRYIALGLMALSFAGCETMDSGISPGEAMMLQQSVNQFNQQQQAIYQQNPYMQPLPNPMGGTATTDCQPNYLTGGMTCRTGY